MRLDLREIIRSLDPEETNIANIIAGKKYGQDLKSVMGLMKNSINKIDACYPDKDDVFKTVKVLQEVESEVNDEDLKFIYVVAFNRVARVINETKQQAISLN